MKYALFIIQGSFGDFDDPETNYVDVHGLDLDEIHDIVRLLSIKDKSFDFVVRPEG